MVGVLGTYFGTLFGPVPETLPGPLFERPPVSVLGPNAIENGQGPDENPDRAWNPGNLD